MPRLPTLTLRRRRSPAASGPPAPLLPYAIRHEDSRLVINLPIVTASEANGRDWKARSNRTHNARAIVSRCLGPHLRLLASIAEHYHAGGRLNVTLTRHGGRMLDKLANLGPALKAVEDAIALMLGADDGDPRWNATAGQRPGGEVGVIVTLAAEETTR